MTGVLGLPAAYRSALRAAAGNALDSGLFYDNAVEAFALAQVGQHDPPRDECVGIFDEPSDFLGRQAFRLTMEVRVAAVPRGTWAAVQHRLPDRTWTNAVMSDGSGSRSVGGSFDHYDVLPTFPGVHRRMAGYEIYKMRYEVEVERCRARNLAVFRERGFRIGRSFHNLLIGRATYSTVTITALHPSPDAHTTIIGTDDRGEGWLSISLIKRGSPKRYGTEIAAVQLAAAIDEAVSAAEATPLCPKPNHPRPSGCMPGRPDNWSPP